MADINFPTPFRMFVKEASTALISIILTLSIFFVPSNFLAEQDEILIEGNITILYFSDNGEITKKHVLNDKDKRYINVPPYTWHTYVVNSNYAITYETMNGIYDPISWKHFANWAPKELSNEASLFLEFLKSNSQNKLA